MEKEKIYYVVGITPKPHWPCNVQEVLINEVPESLLPHLSPDIEWHKFRDRSRALDKLEELQQALAMETKKSIVWLKEVEK